MVRIPITKDSWLSQFKKDMNYGDGKGWKENFVEGEAAMFLGFGGADKKIPVLGFETDELTDMTIENATLKLAVVYSGSSKEEVYEAKAILQKWEESKVTWNNLKKFGPAVSTVKLAGAWNYRNDPVWIEFDVTKIVKDCVTGKAFGIAIDTQGKSGIDRQIESRESDKTDLQPYIEVE